MNTIHSHLLASSYTKRPVAAKHASSQELRLLYKSNQGTKTRTRGDGVKVKSFTYERNWTGKYYRQRLLPSMQTMDKHIASMLSDGWEIMTETSHSGNSRGFRPF